jgi:predicted ArsR family transcriptional regulator
MLLDCASRAGAAAADARASGWEEGAVEAVAALAADSSAACADATVAMLARLGFDPERVDGPDGAMTVGFAHCPYRSLAEANPELVCALHRGVIEGFVATVGGAEVADFGSLVDRHPCRVTLVAR